MVRTVSLQQVPSLRVCQAVFVCAQKGRGSCRSICRQLLLSPRILFGKIKICMLSIFFKRLFLSFHKKTPFAPSPTLHLSLD